VFPTETVYGLGACTLDADAIARIFAVKRRPDDNPLIAHVSDADAALEIASSWDDRCDELARRFWPGPLTLVVGRNDVVPEIATAGRPTIAIRCPRHDVAQRLLAVFGRPVSAPSANRSGGVSPTQARHVAEDFADEEDLLIIDGGRCQLGIESTVLDMTTHPPCVLRPGSISASELRAVLPTVDARPVMEQAASPGTSVRHYAPKTPAMVVDVSQIEDLLKDAGGSQVVLCFDRDHVPAPHRAIVMPSGAGDYARVLYDLLRRADALGCDRILIEEPPLSNEMWRAVHDRLLRATSEL
jgi:L-threonylcarbamoyladenylate synthase